MQKISYLLEALTVEIHHRPIVGLLAVLVLLVHLWVVVLLLQPTGKDNVAKPIKVMEVALVTEPKPEPKKEAEPPATPKAAPAKIVPPKKKPVTPPIKKKVPNIPKQVERPKIKEQKVGVEQIPVPVQATPTEALQKPQKSMPTLQSVAAPMPVAKPGNGKGKSQGVNSGVVELGCPKPKYPMRAMSRHIEGSVKIELTIGTTGSVTEAQVVSAQPPGIFDEVALDAARKCKFKPKIVNGTPVQLKIPKPFRFTLTN